MPNEDAAAKDARDAAAKYVGPEYKRLLDAARRSLERTGGDLTRTVTVKSPDDRARPASTARKASASWRYASPTSTMPSASPSARALPSCSNASARRSRTAPPSGSGWWSDAKPPSVPLTTPS
jgi:hypothetical protein